MPFPAGVTHFVFGGDLPGGEHWQSGLWTHGDNPGTGELANAYCDVFWDTATATDTSGFLYQQLETYGAGGYTLEYVRCYAYEGGRDAAVVGEHVQHLAPASVTPRLPNQACVVASLRTGLAGRQNRGRMYLPVGFITLDGDANMAASDVSAMATNVATFISDWNASGDNGTICVVSQGGTKAPTTIPHFTNVTSVIVDSRMDIQRRRAAQQQIEYSHTATITS